MDLTDEQLKLMRKIYNCLMLIENSVGKEKRIDYCDGLIVNSINLLSALKGTTYCPISDKEIPYV
jgi:hypothetical protein